MQKLFPDSIRHNAAPGYTPPAGGDSFPTGAIVPYGNATAPGGWRNCNGAFVSQATYAALFAVIGHSHGTDPEDGTFKLPDMRNGAVPVGAGTGYGSWTIALGQRTNNAMSDLGVQLGTGMGTALEMVGENYIIKT